MYYSCHHCLLYIQIIWLCRIESKTHPEQIWCYSTFFLSPSSSRAPRDHMMANTMSFCRWLEETSLTSSPLGMRPSSRSRACLVYIHSRTLILGTRDWVMKAYRKGHTLAKISYIVSCWPAGRFNSQAGKYNHILSWLNIQYSMKLVYFTWPELNNTNTFY